jgi:CMP-N-acetylneuraminic acid synthetase
MSQEVFMSQEDSMDIDSKYDLIMAENFLIKREQFPARP